MHALFVVSDAGEDDDWQSLAHFPDKRDKGNAVHFGMFRSTTTTSHWWYSSQAAVLKSFGQEFAGMAFLLEISDKELGDGWVIIDEEEFNGIAGKDFHKWPSYNYYNQYKH